MNIYAERSLFLEQVTYSLVPRPLPRFQCYTQEGGRAWGKCKTWTLDCGLDYGLDCGLRCGLDFD